MFVAEGRPAINSRVAVTDSAGNEFLTRVEDEDGDLLVIAAPTTGTVEHFPEVGDEYLLTWTSTRGLHQLHVVLLAIQRERLRTWMVQIDGPVSLIQRRDRVRVSAVLPAFVHLPDSADPLPVRILDLSEGGIRLTCTDDIAERIEPHIGGERPTLLVDLTLDDVPMSIPARVVREGERQEGRRIFGLAWAADEWQARILRRFVMAWQRRARAQGLPL